MTNSHSPPDLGARLRAGDDSVLESILQTHGPPILTLLKQRFAGRLTVADLEEVLASALFRLWQNRYRFDSELASLRVWFFRIAENLSRDVLKHGWQKARQLEQSVEPSWLSLVLDRRNVESDDEVDTGPLQELRVPSDELRELLEMLPATQRYIIMADANSPEGSVPSQDLANELGIPAATVRVYRRRGLERLRKEIEQRELAAPAKASE